MAAKPNTAASHRVWHPHRAETAERCPCGQPLHYSDPAIEAYVQLEVDRLGPTVAVRSTRGTWSVPRHFLALHQIARTAVPQLARLYHWTRTRAS